MLRPSALKTFSGIVIASALVASISIAIGSSASASVNEGSIDTTFGTAGYVTIASGVSIQYEPIEVDVLADGRILAAYTDGNDVLIRAYNTTGQLDTSFGTAGTLTITGDFISTIYPLPSGGFFVGGQSGDVYKYGSNGVIDTSFGVSGKASPPSGGGPEPAEFFSIDPSSGAIVTTGEESGSGWSRINRYTSTGSGANTTQVSTNMDAVSLKVGNRLYVAGSPGSNYFNTSPKIRAYTWTSASTGTPTIDTTFMSSNTPQGIWTADSVATLNNARIFDLDVDSNGKLVVSLFDDDGSNDKYVTLLRLDPTAATSAAAFDNTFGSSGLANSTLKAADAQQPSRASGGTYIQSDGKIVTIIDSGIVRMSSTGALDTSYGTGGKVVTSYNMGAPVEASLDGVLAANNQVIRFFREDPGTGTSNRFSLKLVRHGIPPVTAPTAPTITGITAGDGELSVAFTTPTSNGGAAITNYEYRVNGGTWTVRSPASTTSPLTIAGLTNDTAYSVEIRAVNSAGSGAASSSSSSTPTTSSTSSTSSSTPAASGGSSGSSSTSTTSAATATTAAATSTTVANVYVNAKPGITVTDSKVYTAPPSAVSANSAIYVLTEAQNKVMDVQTLTPSVCLPNDDELVFINSGQCISQVVNAKTRAVLRTLKISVVPDDISVVKIGNEIVTLAPIYFDVMSSTVDAKAMARLKSLKSKISAAGSVLLIGHSGTLNGNSPANVAISRDRASATLAALKSIGAKGPFAISGVGALDPANTGKTEADQAKNRRVVIALIP